VRLAPAALYTSFAECNDAVEILREIMATEAYMEYSR
jgi:kynureninase